VQLSMSMNCIPCPRLGLSASVARQELAQTNQYGTNEWE
jgi:hypothetical protein